MSASADKVPWKLTDEWAYIPEQDLFWLHARRVDAPNSALDVSAHYSVFDGTLRMHELRVSREGTNPELTANDLRSVPLSTLHRFARELIARRQPPPGYPGTEPWPMPPRDWLQDFTMSPRPGRRRRDERAYAVVAARYVELLAISETPVKDLALELDRTPSQVRTLLHEARKRDLLTRATTPGHAGGDLTPKAKELLHGTH